MRRFESALARENMRRLSLITALLAGVEADRRGYEEDRILNRRPELQPGTFHYRPASLAALHAPDYRAAQAEKAAAELDPTPSAEDNPIYHVKIPVLSLGD